MAVYIPRTTHLGERYELKSQAGTGGMGTVFQAFDRATKQLVAVKVLHGKGENDAARFAREAELLSQLESPAIVRFIDHGTTAHGEPYFVMEWLDGETLDERLRRGTLSASVVARLASRVLEGLGAAHRKGFIHRDMKPSNIFLTGYRVAEAKVIDFGVARHTDDAFRLTRRGNTVGTPMYNAPEQARGRGDLDGRVDIFAIGCVMYEALTGEPAYAGDTPGQVMTLIASGQGPDLDLRLAHVDSELRTVIDAMMAFRRDERPADAGGLAARLAAIADRLAPLEAPAPLPIRSAGSARGAATRQGISLTEQRILSVLVVARFTRTEERPASGYFGKGEPRVLPDDLVSRLTKALEPYGGRVDRLLDRSLVVTAPALLSPSEQAEQIARMGLAVVAQEPSLTAAMATGRGALLARLPAGQVIEQAAALLEAGCSGHVALDETSARLISPHFSTVQDQNTHLLKAERDVTPQPRRIFGQTMTFTGRERTLALMTSLIIQCKSESEPKAIVVTAREGIGKSRMVNEWIGRMYHRADEVTVLWSRAVPVASPQAYPALRTMFDQIRVPAAHRNDPQRVADAFVQWVKNQSRTRLVILYLENAHVADTASLQFLENAMAQLANARVLVVLNGRPELDERVPDLFEQRAPLRVRLAPLTRRHMEISLRGILPTPAPETDEWIYARCRGNAAAVEELARHAATVGCVSLPDAVVGLVQHELEGLGGEARRLLRAAAVFGDDGFDAAGVAALLGDPPIADVEQTLASLAEAGHMVNDVTNTQQPWRFAETVVRESVVSTLPAADRTLARRLARAYLERTGRPVPASLLPGDSNATVTPGQSPALGFLARR